MNVVSLLRCWTRTEPRQQVEWWYVCVGYGHRNALSFRYDEMFFVFIISFVFVFGLLCLMVLGTFDGCISISALQWLCNADNNEQNPVKRINRCVPFALSVLFYMLYFVMRSSNLHRFFLSLYGCMIRGSRCIFQFYPGNELYWNSLLLLCLFFKIDHHLFSSWVLILIFREHVAVGAANVCRAPFWICRRSARGLSEFCEGKKVWDWSIGVEGVLIDSFSPFFIGSIF
jgi:hypothetical protein